jgi:hypothetical protein
LGPLGITANSRPIVLAPGVYDGEIGGMIGMENRSTRRKHAPVPLCLCLPRREPGPPRASLCTDSAAPAHISPL